MTIDRFLINSNFEITGENFSRIINSNFEISDEILDVQITETGVQLNALSGIISKNNGFSDSIVVNAKISAYKKGKLFDRDITDKDGFYSLYLENGIYDIRIEGQTYNRTIKNYEVTSGIREYSKNIKKGQILSKNFDVTTFYSQSTPHNKFLISGTIIDEQGLPTENAEIIIGIVDENSKNKKIATFVKTDKKGYFSFELAEGKYDIVLRSSKHRAKIIKNYTFISTQGFFPPISDSSLLFRKGDEILWISN